MIFIIIVFFLNIKFDNDKIIKLNDERIRNIGNTKINNLLYHYFDKYNYKGQIYSHYYELKWLPKLNNRYKEFNCTLGNLKSYEKLIKESSNNFYILFTPWCDEGIVNYVLKKNINIIFEHENFIFIEVKYY